MLNEKLFKKQNLTETDRETLYELYSQLGVLITQSKDNLSDEEYKRIGSSVETIEFALQRVWGFSEDSNFHRHYMKLDGCSCGNIDNRESWGFRRYNNGDCKYHGIN